MKAFWSGDRKKWIAVLSLAAYDLWLLAFPLQGYFLIKIQKTSNFVFFVIPHTVVLFVTGFLGYKVPFEKTSKLSAILTAVFTCLFPFLTGYEPYAMALIGVFSAVLIVKIGCLLSDTEDHTLNSALGLAIGNIFLAILLSLKLPEPILFIAIGVPLVITLFARCPEQKHGNLADILYYLPLVFMFYLFIGTFYVCLMPAYVKFMYVNGLELLLYILAVLLSAFLFSLKPELSFAIGISLGLVATSFFAYLQ